MTEPREETTAGIRVVWGTGLALYVLMSIVFGFVTIALPWLGVIVVLVCVSVHMARQKQDNPILLALAVGQVCLATLASRLLVPSVSPGRAVFSLVFVLALLGPFFIGVYAVRKPRPRPIPDPTHDDSSSV